jgi:hypothetical protein
MSRCTISWRHLAVVGAISLLGACAQTPPHAVAVNPPHVASNPPPVAPGLGAVWYSVSFTALPSTPKERRWSTMWPFT